MDTLTIRNPELEKIRHEVLEFKQDDEKLAKELISHLSSIHVGYLFCSGGKAALSQICVVISSTSAASLATQTSSWKDLAAHLGLNFLQIRCIENGTNIDYTETVLKWYAQNKDATIDRIVTALSKLKRFDAIVMARPYLLELEKYARKEQIKRTDEEDFRYHCVDGLETEEPTHDGILRPAGLRHLKAQLQITLRNLETPVNEESFFENRQKIEENLQQATVIYRTPRQKKCSKCVLLTFASDGEKTALNIANELRKPRGSFLPIGVLILDEHSDLVEANPEQFITHYFPKMDFIIPIITPKYLDSIEKDSSREENYFCSIDSRYVQMIHTLMTKYYVENSCRNDKFRSVIPDNYVELLKDSRMKRDLVLQAFVLESKINSLAMRMIKKKK